MSRITHERNVEAIRRAGADFVLSYTSLGVDSIMSLVNGDATVMLGEGSGCTEILGSLAARARRTLADLGYRNIEVRTGNGYLGWPEHGPYDRIMVTAAPDEVPPALVQQLKIGGLMAIPVGTVRQELRMIRRDDSDGDAHDASGPVRAHDRDALSHNNGRTKVRID